MCLHLCLIADYEIPGGPGQKRAGIVGQRSPDESFARKMRSAPVWIDTLFQKKDPWDPSLYDIVIPTDKLTVRKRSARLVEKNLAQPNCQDLRRNPEKRSGIFCWPPRPRWPWPGRGTRWG